MKNRLLASIVALALALPLASGCASTGGFKAAGFQGLTAVGQALYLVQDTDMGLRCGAPTAPAAPACIPEALHQDISKKLAVAFALGEKTSGALQALPATITSPTPEIQGFITQLWELVNEIVALLPQSNPKAKLTSQLEKLTKK